MILDHSGDEYIPGKSESQTLAPEKDLKMDIHLP